MSHEVGTFIILISQPRKQGTNSLSDLPRVTQSVRGEASSVWTPSPSPSLDGVQGGGQSGVGSEDLSENSAPDPRFHS